MSITNRNHKHWLDVGLLLDQYTTPIQLRQQQHCTQGKLQPAYRPGRYDALRAVLMRDICV
jgi:hypothetical protein